MDDAANNPTPNGHDGYNRDGLGRFGQGNPGGPGSPQAEKVSQWRAALAGAVTPQDITAVMHVLVEKAKAGESWAVRELLDRTCGKPRESVEVAMAGHFPTLTMSPEEEELASRICARRLRPLMDEHEHPD